jgi:hypothetical protein
MYAFTAAVSSVWRAAACFFLATARRASVADSCALICARWTVAWSYCSESCANDCCCVANSDSTASTCACVELMAAPVPVDCPAPAFGVPGDATAGGVATEPATMIVDTSRAARRATV